MIHDRYHSQLTYFLIFFRSVPSQGGCTQHSDCLFSEACVEGLCSDPCHCGVNAECYVSQHRPYCTCPPSYIGEPSVACYRGRLKFTSGKVYMEDCRNSDTCFIYFCNAKLSQYIHFHIHFTGNFWNRMQ